MPKGIPTKTKICPICGDEFLPEKPSQRYCKKDHYQPCPVCGKPVLWNSMREVPVCSKECKRERMHARNQEKYGVDHPMSLKSVQEKHKASMKEHYGVEHALQSSELKEKAKSTTRERYGVDWAMSNESIKHKAQDSMEAKYGYKSSFQSPELMAKARKTMIEKYGTVNPRKSLEVQAKCENTLMQLYGVDNPLKNDDIKSRARNTRLQNHEGVYWTDEMESKRNNTNLERYGTVNPTSTETVKARVRKGMMDKYGVPYPCLLPSAQTDNVKSKVNYKFLEFLQCNGMDVSETDMEFHIGNRSYDFKIPDSNVLVEINPTYTHNSFGNHFNENGLASNYHSMKSKLAQEHGYRCIHVWDWDNWDKIVSLIRSTQNKVYARNTEIYVVKNMKLINKFLNDNHIQGTVRGQVLCFGLVKDDELIELMTFGKPRYNKKFDGELLRLCTKQDTIVIGGASKLFSYATKYFSLGKIISYCDLSKFNGTVYEKLNMTLDHTTSPTKIWSKGTKYITSNMLASRGFDQLFKTNYGKGTDNEILMLDHGWLPVYDCGQAVYTFDCGM